MQELFSTSYVGKPKNPTKINGRTYTLWPQFVERKAEFIGGTLEELPGDGPGATTTITDIRFEPNGTESAMFSIDGEEFSCAIDVRYLAVDPDLGGDGWIGFVCAMFNHRYRIRPRAGNQAPADMVPNDRAGKLTDAQRAELAADIETERRRELRAFGENPENA